MYIFISGFERLDGQRLRMWLTLSAYVLQRKKARSRNEASKLGWKVAGLRNKCL